MENLNLDEFTPQQRRAVMCFFEENPSGIGSVQEWRKYRGFGAKALAKAIRRGWVLDYLDSHGNVYPEPKDKAGKDLLDSMVSINGQIRRLEKEIKVLREDLLRKEAQYAAQSDPPTV